tara:strand:- start:804 stop:968 length:165 start_codon:yes stop_codon:yes gene_type:complete
MKDLKDSAFGNGSAKLHEVISKLTITDRANPELAQNILSWTKDSVTDIVYKKKF